MTTYPTNRAVDALRRCGLAVAAVIGGALVAACDLSVLIGDSPDPAVVGGNITYTIDVAADSDGWDDTVSSFTASACVKDVLPAGVQLVSANASQGSCTGTTTVTCDLGTMAPNGTAQVVIVVQALAENPALTNTVTVGDVGFGCEYNSLVNQETNSANNTATTVTQVLDDSCPSVPSATCKASADRKTVISLKDDVPGKKDKFQLNWKGAATALGELGDPTSSTGYRLCLYQGATTPFAEVEIPAGGTCGTKPCWKSMKTGYKFSRKPSAPGGADSVVLKAGADGKASVQVKGSGYDFPIPPFASLSLPVVAQVHASNGSCWSATFDVLTLQNAGGKFKAKD